MYVCMYVYLSVCLNTYFPFKSNVYIISNLTINKTKHYTAQTRFRCSYLAMLMSLSETICLSVCQRTFIENIKGNTEKATYNTKSLR